MAGVAYQIVVDGYQGFFGGVASGNIALSIASAQPPANDNFASRIFLTGTMVRAYGTTVGATKESGEPLHAGNAGGRSVWWTWTAPLTGYVEVSTAGSDFNTLLGVYFGNTVGALTTVAANDQDPEGGSTSRLGFFAMQGSDYEIVADGYNGAFGNVTLNISQLARANDLYFTGFEASEGYVIGQALAGQNGWQGVGSGGNGLVTNIFSGGGQQAYIGFSAPSLGDVELLLRRPLNFTPNTNQVVLFATKMRITDSTNGRFDIFKWRIYNRSGNRLFTLGFDNLNAEIYYQLDDDVQRLTGFSFNKANIYQLVIFFDFANNLWSASVENSLVVNRQPITTLNAPRDIGSIDPVWGIRSAGQPGNNWMAFDDYGFGVIERLFPPQIVIQPQSQAIMAGANAYLSVTATGTASLSYQWYHDDYPLLNANSSSLSRSSAQTNESGRYWVVVTNLVGSATSQEAVLVISPVVLPPPNNNFANRIMLTGVSNLVSGSNVAATKEVGEPAHAGNLGGKSVWLTWTAPSSGWFTVSTLGSDFDTLLSVYTGASLGALTPVAGNDDAQTATRGSLVTFYTLNGLAYQIAVDGFNGDSGDIRLAIHPAFLPQLTGPSNFTSGFQATLNAETGLRYEIQASPNLTGWTTITNQLSMGTPLQFADPASSNFSRRFYRAVQQP